MSKKYPDASAVYVTFPGEEFLQSIRMKPMGRYIRGKLLITHTSGYKVKKRKKNNHFPKKQWTSKGEIKYWQRYGKRRSRYEYRDSWWVFPIYSIDHWYGYSREWVFVDVPLAAGIRVTRKSELKRLIREWNQALDEAGIEPKNVTKLDGWEELNWQEEYPYTGSWQDAVAIWNRIEKEDLEDWDDDWRPYPPLEEK